MQPPSRRGCRCCRDQAVPLGLLGETADQTCLSTGDGRERRVLCGAGVKNGTDVATALDLGAEGVLLASGVTKASDVDAVLKDLIAYL